MVNRVNSLISFKVKVKVACCYEGHRIGMCVPVGAVKVPQCASCIHLCKLLAVDIDVCLYHTTVLLTQCKATPIETATVVLVYCGNVQLHHTYISCKEMLPAGGQLCTPVHVYFVPAATHFSSVRLRHTRRWQ